jgi:hypothetical protein
VTFYWAPFGELFSLCISLVPASRNVRGCSMSSFIPSSFFRMGLFVRGRLYGVLRF